MYHPRNAALLGRIKDLETALEVQRLRIDAISKRTEHLVLVGKRLPLQQQSPLQPQPLAEPNPPYNDWLEKYKLSQKLDNFTNRINAAWQAGTK